MLETLLRGISTLGLTLNDEQLALFERYYRLLASSGKRARVSSVLDYEGVQRRHFLESLALASQLRKAGLLDDRGFPSVIDLGSGGGFPGVPLKILLPRVRLTLLEASEKKSAFLREVVASLPLAETSVVTARAEDAGRQEEYRDRYDIVLARAIAALPILLELAVPLLRVGGHLATLKGSRWEAEVRESQPALAELKARIEVALPMVVPEGKYEQTLVLIEKMGPTPSRYPRRAGIPEKRPL